MKPLNKFRMLTNAPFFMIVQREKDGGIEPDTIKDFFKLTDGEIVFGTKTGQDGHFALQVGGLN